MKDQATGPSFWGKEVVGGISRALKGVSGTNPKVYTGP